MSPILKCKSTLNPLGEVPLVVFHDGEALAESNAIIYHLAEGSALIPEDPLQRARMFQWMFWEQYSHEPYIAVRRFQLSFLGRSEDELDPRLLKRGDEALSAMESHLNKSPFFVADFLTLADVALVAYTRMAHEGGFNLDERPAVKDWIGLVEDKLNIRAKSPKPLAD